MRHHAGRGAGPVSDRKRRTQAHDLTDARPQIGRHLGESVNRRLDDLGKTLGKKAEIRTH
jgi:hypothetical protein